MAFYSVDSATKFIKSKITEVYKQGPILKDQLIAVSRVIGAMKKQPIIRVAAKLNEAERLRKAIGASIHQQIKIETEVYPWARFFGIDQSLGSHEEQLGVIIVPILLAGTALAIAAMISNHFLKIRNQQRTLELIAKGVLTPAEAAALKPKTTGVVAQITGAIGGIQNVVIIGVLAVGAFFLFGIGRKPA